MATDLAFSGCAAARYRYHDDCYDRGSAHQAHAYGIQNGYTDGYRKGQHEGRENDPGDINVRALEQATHGYRSWMGAKLNLFGTAIETDTVAVFARDMNRRIGGGEIAPLMIIDIDRVHFRGSSDFSLLGLFNL